MPDSDYIYEVVLTRRVTTPSPEGLVVKYEAEHALQNAGFVAIFANNHGPWTVSADVVQGCMVTVYENDSWTMIVRESLDD